MALNTLGPDAEKQGGESFRWAGKLHCVKSRVWKYIKYALLSVVIVIGALLLFLPTILYHLPILSVGLYLKMPFFFVLFFCFFFEGGGLWDKSGLHGRWHNDMMLSLAHAVICTSPASCYL